MKIIKRFFGFVLKLINIKHFITFLNFLRHAAFISCRRCFDYENHALTVLESAYQKMHNGRVKIITGIRRYEKYHL